MGVGSLVVFAAARHGVMIGAPGAHAAGSLVAYAFGAQD
jgi:hypothetical protein